MPGGGMGALKSAERSAVGEIEQKQSEVISSIGAQEAKAKVRVRKSVSERISSYKERRSSINNSLKQLRSQLERIPNIDDPRAQEARKRIKSQVKQLESALSQIDTAIRIANQEAGAQIGQVSENMEGERKKIKIKFKSQKTSVLMKFTAQKAMMANQMRMYQQRRGSEGGKAKG